MALQPPKGSPFQGISNTNAPARNTRVPNLTEKVTLAKTRKAALTHGGLLTPEQQQAASAAGKALAAHKAAKRAATTQNASPVTPPKPSAKKPPGDSTTPKTLPLPSSAPFKVPPPSAPASASQPPPHGRRGTTSPRLQAQQNQPHQGGLLSQAADYLSGPAIGKTAANAVIHAADVGAGTTIAALGPSALTDVKHPIAAVQAIHKRGLVTTEQASTDLAARLARTGVSGGIPEGFSIPSIDLVQPAGAAVTKKAITKDELAALEAQGVDLKPRLKTRFAKQALKNGWNTAELDGLSGSALIDKAFTHPAPLPLRALGNTAKGIAQLGTLPAGVEGAIRETAAGHGGDVAKALGEGLYSELPVVGKHPFGQTVVADPFGSLTQFAGAGKVVGEAGRLGKLDRGLREVETASSGLKVNRGKMSRNAYVATGQALSDAAARRIPAAGARLEARAVDQAVRSATNKHAPEFVAVQRPYAAALDKVGRSRAAELIAYQQSGGKPEQLAAFYRAQGEKGPAKFYARVAENTKAMSPEDQAFVDAHSALVAKTTQAWMATGKFSDTAAEFRRYSPLIRSSAHLGDPEAQRILALRDEYLKGFNQMPEQDVAALRGAIDQGVQDFASKHMASGVEPVPAPGRHELDPDELVSYRNSGRGASGLVTQSGRTLGPDDWVTLFHGTTPEVAAAAVKGGFKTGGKVSKVAEPITDPVVANMLGKNVGDVPDYEIGRGAGGGVYLAPSEKDVSLFGSSVLAIRVRVRDLSVPPERKVLERHGEQAAAHSVMVGDGYTDKAIPAENISLYSAPSRGGIEPTYVEYGKPKPVIASPFTPSAGGTVGFKTPRGKQKVETGATFEGGKFLIDPASPLAQSVRAQRAHLSSVLHEDVSNAVGTHLTAGDPIPAGHVFVSETNLRGLRRTTNDLADNPVSAPDYYAEEAGVRQKLFDHLSANATPSGERVPRGEKGYAIPEAAWRRILDHTRPPSRGAYSRFLRQYQRVLVSYRPSTIVNNTLGSIPLAMTGGAGPKSFKLAAEAMRDPTLAPAVLRAHGVAGSFAPDARSTIGSGLDFMRAQSAKGEDFSRLATFFSKAGPTIKKRAAALNQTTDEYARAFAAGRIDEPLLNQALDHTEQFIGDMLKPDGPLARKAGKVILFHNWVGHIAKLLLYTLPVNHPRRLVLLMTLAKYGDQYRQQHGVWPDWYREYLPLFQHVERIGRMGKPQTFTKTFSMQGINPYSTLNQFSTPVSTDESLKNILAGVAAPPIQIAFNAIANRPADSTSVPRYVAGQALRQVPGVSVVRPQSGMGPDSIPFFSEERKRYSSGRKVNGKSVPLPYDFRPTARPQTGVEGALLRYLLGGVYDVPAQGPIHNIDQKKHIGAVAKAARHH